MAVKVQAQTHGVLVHQLFTKLKVALRGSKLSILKLQSFARVRIFRRDHKEVTKILYTPQMSQAVIQFQAVVHGTLGRQVVEECDHALEQVEPYIVNMQGHGRLH